MKLLWTATPFIFLLPAVTTLGQQTTGKQPPLLCRFDSLPPLIQRHLMKECGSWKVQEAADLSPQARESAWANDVEPMTISLLPRALIGV